MAKRTLSFNDYEEPTWEEYTGEDPPVGRWFNANVTRARYDDDGDQMIFICEIADGDFKGWGRGWYAPFEGARKFKFHTIVKALQGGLTKDVTLDWENDAAVKTWLSKQRTIRIKIGTYNDRINIDRVAPLLEAVGSAGTAKSNAKAAVAAPDPEPVADDEPVEDYTEAELKEMEVSDLEEILTEEFELPADDDDFPQKGTGRGAAAKYKAALVEAILAEQEAGDEDDNQDAVEADAAGEEDDEFEDGFEEDGDADEEDPEPEPEPEPTPRARRSRAAKPAPAPEPEAKPATRRRRR